MSEMSNENSENNGINRDRPVGEGFDAAGVPLFNSMDPIVMLLLSEQSGQERE